MIRKQGGLTKPVIRLIIYETQQLRFVLQAWLLSRAIVLRMSFQQARIAARVLFRGMLAQGPRCL